ncbi:universal stress protein (plasmid) [Deinococcus radiomollis]|uniref:universal stress protein n=1 Tax=Deinococcus radiomollis TaxID=468916 RepID=UPI0038920912
MYRHILVTSDGSEFSDPALQHAATLARCVGSRLTVLHVVPDAHLDLSTGDDLSVEARTLEQGWREGSETDFARIRTLLAGTEFEMRLVQAHHAHVAQVIRREADRLGVDLIVMATHGRTGMAHLIHGSVAEDVMKHVTVPTLLIYRRG